MKNRKYRAAMRKVKKKIGLISIVIFLLFHIVVLLKLPAGRSLHPGLQAASNPLRLLTQSSVGADDTSFSGLLPFSTTGRWFPPAIGRTELIGREAEQDTPSIFVSVRAGGAVSQNTARPQNFWLDELIEKIWSIESGGRTDCPDGDNGEAIGPLQIHPCALEDVNRRYGTNFVREDLRNIKTAKIVAKLYISYWFEANKQEIAARIFNGGPRGWRKRTTDEYWEKVKGIE